ncbi:glutaredoxin family protein [Bacteroidales bacterium AH-315-I05]|nr:glutaredoxin family protein [Bacteroidales bacterium AH-315-I05]
MKNIVMYGTQWCADCIRTKMFLKAKNIDYKSIDIDKDEQMAQKVIEINNGKRIVPTLVIDGVAYSNPGYRELAEILGL